MWGKTCAGFLKSLRHFIIKPCVCVFLLLSLFHYDRIFIFGSKCIFFTNLSLYLCIKLVLSLLNVYKIWFGKKTGGFSIHNAD